MRQASVFAVLAALGWTMAAPLPASAQYGPGVLAPFEVVTILRSTDLQPVGRPVRRGAHYAVTAIDERGDDVRVLVDARSGEIVSVRPLRRYVERSYPPETVYVEPGPLFGGPRIIYEEPRGYYPPEALPERGRSATGPRVIRAPSSTGALPRDGDRRTESPSVRTQTARLSGPPPMPRPRPEEVSARPSEPVKVWPGLEKDGEAGPLPPPIPEAKPGTAPLPE